MIVPIAEALGRPIACPDEGCGATCWVEKSRQVAPRVGGIPPPPDTANPGPAGQTAMTAHLWFLVHCPRTGSKLFWHTTPVEVRDG
jgi:hypothetical protein